MKQDKPPKPSGNKDQKAALPQHKAMAMGKTVNKGRETPRIRP